MCVWKGYIIKRLKGPKSWIVRAELEAFSPSFETILSVWWIVRIAVKVSFWGERKCEFPNCHLVRKNAWISNCNSDNCENPVVYGVNCSPGNGFMHGTIVKTKCTRENPIVEIHTCHAICKCESGSLKRDGFDRCTIVVPCLAKGFSMIEKTNASDRKVHPCSFRPKDGEVPCSWITVFSTHFQFSFRSLQRRLTAPLKNSPVEGTCIYMWWALFDS